MEVPETRYAKTAEGVYVACQVFGEGPADLVFLPEWVTHCEAAWEHPLFASVLKRTGSIARVIAFDKRGIGLSDRVAAGEVPSLEAWLDDLEAVLDTAGAERPVLLGMGHGGLLAVLFAATFPERTGGLILANAYARLARAPDYPFGYPQAVQDVVVSKTEAEWGATGWVVDFLAPSLARDDSIKQWWRRMERLACTPGTGAAMQRASFEQDIRHALGSIRAPTLVMHVTGNHHVIAEHGRYLAEHISGARYVELPGEDHWFLWGESGEESFVEIADFLGAVPPAVETDRVLTTLLFSDVVESTALANKLGDRRWHALLDRLDDLVRRHVERFRGRIIKSTGDGHLIIFDGAGRAIRCATAIVDGARGLGLTMRAGLHTGEVELRGDDVAGVVVHIAQRITDIAAPGEVLVSRTLVDLVAGSDLEFSDRNDNKLKGIPGTWRLFAIEA